MIDSALIRLVGFQISEDKGRLLENVVFTHLKMHGQEIYFHKERKECDFLIRKNNRIIQAIQVATHISNEKVKKLLGLTLRTDEECFVELGRQLLGIEKAST